ncbi:MULTISPECIES: SDR family oxidoreductase [Prauserella salsuginis group]|uniref:NAD(P)-dependent dehydrogenase (Short-subunit alcohol dehydrogenase family) n=2 Tax=Prauserella salsuginis group TaxID=2893672 RepID=A0A839XMR3_9PSEU|nr:MULTISPECIES: SDR family oxidoreductase [Prauserella salsuginis group]MBB3661286.1 NAD(P)-dependent dehydrogenase (short-subunit alcohol dehydrogenase family) [Prauserella sediminis]MCR3719209.1 NAD(P)-dependent dehydrogenase, short-chain alcohol dehydrogenase family [Prauserella flava]MCR3735778.1 NAD(P)-dependent dehydrogenase, short-chain alcohol dehydrogenase family [Prauserella salsuginis]
MATRELSYDGAVVLVTGGARGVGAGISDVFRELGAQVVVCGRTAPEGGGADFVSCDVRDPAQIAAMMEQVLERWGRLDVVVNNAGGAPHADAGTASPRFHDKIVQLNLLAPLHVAQQANEVMQRQDGGGSIVMVGSVSGRRSSPGTAAYGAAKAGIDNLTASLAVEWAPKVRVNALAVGMVRTEQTHLHYGGADGVAAVGATVPLGRLAEPAEIGRCAAFLASPLASYVTGASLLVHGGGERPAFLAAAEADGAGVPDREIRRENAHG